MTDMVAMLQREVHKTYEYRDGDRMKGTMQRRFEGICWTDGEDARCGVCHGESKLQVHLTRI